MSPLEVVRQFIERVRSGREPGATLQMMAPKVLSHQVVSGQPTVVERTPQNYTEHIEEFLAAFGPYEFAIEELLSQGDKVYVRWRQSGHHIGTVLGYAPTGKPLVTVGSAVYRVSEGQIVEYWIQQENYGLEKQLRKNATAIPILRAYPSRASGMEISR